MIARGFTLLEFMIAIAIVLILGLIAFPLLWKPQHSCVEFGYPDTRITRLGKYCVRRVNGTDEIIPLRDLIDRYEHDIER